MIGLPTLATSPQEYYPIGTKKCPVHNVKLERATIIARHSIDDTHDAPFCTSLEVLRCKKCREVLAKNSKRHSKEQKVVTPLPRTQVPSN
jgi:hypothetical protein